MIRILGEKASDELWPLEGIAGRLFVGGRRLRDWQEAFDPGEEVTLMGNAWVNPKDWRHLLETGAEAILETPEGDFLAWTGGGERPDHAMVVLASGQSGVVRYPWDLLTVNEEVLSGVEASSSPGGALLAEGARLVVGEGTAILPGVYVEGTVLVGADCKIGPNCYLRGSTAIGDGCHIGQAVEVKNSIVGPGSSVGHLSYVGDSILGENVNFGAGTITSNLRHDGRNHRSQAGGRLVETGRRKFGTVVGNGVHTGIHTSIYPGRKLGPGATTLPGEIVQGDKI
ncbi:MAG: hypothetical protein HKN82_17635 [Akkermansiaceae bacterium]|nr:hypothetical protein [Akkermansiaceae bacterium]NNM30753.1 hypothetical protein [Akkermansiaceae bacterium]